MANEAHERWRAEPARRLFRRGLDLLVDIRGDSLQRVVERHLAGDGLPEPRRRRVEDGAVELVALDLIGDGRELRDLGDEYIQRRLGLRRDLVFDAFLRDSRVGRNVLGARHVLGVYRLARQIVEKTGHNPWNL